MGKASVKANLGGWVVIQVYVNMVKVVVSIYSRNSLGIQKKGKKNLKALRRLSMLGGPQEPRSIEMDVGDKERHHARRNWKCQFGMRVREMQHYVAGPTCMECNRTSCTFLTLQNWIACFSIIVGHRMTLLQIF